MSEAQILEFAGLAIALLGIGFMLSRGHYLKLVDDIKNNSAILFTFGVINLIIGYLLVVNYNIWAWDWSVVITIIGWMALLKGTVILIFPQAHLKIADQALDKLGDKVKLVGGILLVLGAALVYISRALV